MKAKILGRLWEVRFVPFLGSARGTCDPPDQRSKAIRISRGLKGEELLEVIIHEAMHAADWSKDEEFVDQFGKDLARLLTRLGYKRDPDA